MAIAANSKAPYAPAATVTNLLKRFRDKGLSVPVTPDILLRAGISESLVQRVMQTLQLLELVDENGQPTEVLNKIRGVPEKDYKPTLAAWIKHVYAEVFSFADPATDDETHIRDAFRAYVPHAQQERMVKLFLALCAEAGLAPESQKAEEKPRVRSALLPFRTASASTLSGRRKIVDALMQQQFGTLPPPLAGLLQSLPSATTGWTKQDRDKFVETFKSVLDYVIPVVAKVPVKDAGEDAE